MNGEEGFRVGNLYPSIIVVQISFNWFCDGNVIKLVGIIYRIMKYTNNLESLT